MTTKEKLGFIALGLVIWVVATSVFRITGSAFFEASVTGYWVNVIFTGISHSSASLVLMKWRKIEQKFRLQGAVCIALPGMLGEIPILAGFSELMSNMQPTTAGQYAAFLFGGYSVLLGVALLMSAKASSQPISETQLAGTK